MCLYSRQIMPAKAKKDIVCYKMMRPTKYKLDASFETFETPYQGMDMTLGHLHHAYPWCTKKVPMLGLNRQACITYGYIHAYTAKRPIPAICKGLKGDRLVLVECIIPKDTLYYKSIDGNEICAKSIKLVKVVG